MAKLICEGLKAGGADASMMKAGSVSAGDIGGYDLLVLGSPAMGAEVLEEDEMEPFFSSIEGSLSEKKSRFVRFVRLGRRRMDAHMGRPRAFCRRQVV